MFCEKHSWRWWHISKVWHGVAIPALGRSIRGCYDIKRFRLKVSRWKEIFVYFSPALPVQKTETSFAWRTHTFYIFITMLFCQSVILYWSSLRCYVFVNFKYLIFVFKNLCNPTYTVKRWDLKSVDTRLMSLCTVNSHSKFSLG